MVNGPSVLIETTNGKLNINSVPLDSHPLMHIAGLPNYQQQQQSAAEEDTSDTHGP